MRLIEMPPREQSHALLCSRPGEAGGFENHPYKTTIRERLLQIGICKSEKSRRFTIKYK